MLGLILSTLILIMVVLICLRGFRRKRCRDCAFKEEDYITSLSGRGLYRFSYCQLLVHDCFVVEPDIERQCEDFKKREDMEPMGMKG